MRPGLSCVPARAGSRHHIVAAAAVAALLLAGCGGPRGDGAPVAFDGDGAYRFVEGLVLDHGTPRFRVPGTAGHAAAADWLEEAMDMRGWQVRRESFNGSQYWALDLDPVEPYVAGARCSGSVRSGVEALTFTNLVATWTGPQMESPRDAAIDHLLFGAHWDSKAHSSSGSPVLGANDGASGVGVLLQVMEHVSRGDVDPGVARLDVVFFDGEDGFEDCHPLAGSLYHAQNLGRAALPDAMLLLDMVGDPEARFPRESQSVDSAPALVEYLWSMQERFGLEANFLDDERTVVDDHVAFIHEGVPSVDIVDAARIGGRSGFPPYWHTDGDTMENIDAGMLGRVGALVSAFLEAPSPEGEGDGNTA